MVQTLADIVFRRTELGTGSHPGEAALAEVAAFMSQRLGWSARQMLEQRRYVDEQFARYFAAPEPLRQTA